MTNDQLGLHPAAPLGPSERAELDFLRYEASYLQRRVRELEDEVHAVEVERDTIRHERNLMSQDFRWTLDKLASSPAGPMLKRTDGFQRMVDTWGEPPT